MTLIKDFPTCGAVAVAIFALAIFAFSQGAIDWQHVWGNGIFGGILCGLRAMQIESEAGHA